MASLSVHACIVSASSALCPNAAGECAFKLSMLCQRGAPGCKYWRYFKSTWVCMCVWQRDGDNRQMSMQLDIMIRRQRPPDRVTEWTLELSCLQTETTCNLPVFVYLSVFGIKIKVLGNIFQSFSSTAASSEYVTVSTSCPYHPALIIWLTWDCHLCQWWIWWCLNSNDLFFVQSTLRSAKPYILISR